MQIKFTIRLLLCFLLIATNTALAAQESRIHSIFNQHFQKYKEREYLSGMALGYLIPGQSIKSYFVGKVSHDVNSATVSKDTLFQIGSITKSYTAVMLLKAEESKKIKLEDTLAKWLPQYSNWPANITIEQLLNMTANLPNYSDAPLWFAQETLEPEKKWTSQELINFVYPKKANIPLRKGYFYSNTGYILSTLIFEKSTQRSFDKSLQKLVEDAGLNNTFYPMPTLKSSIQKKIAHGYNYNPYDNPALVGKDMFNNDLSWAGSAGAMLSTPEDIIKWVQYLFVDENSLSKQQRKRLMTVNSTHTGNPIHKLTKEDNEGFGLGVAHMYREELGDFWFYEGITLGFRAFYIYKPCNGVTIAITANSTPDKSNDSLSKLITDVYKQIIVENPSLQCKV